MCGVYLVGLTYCREEYTLLEIKIGNTIRMPILFFEVLPPDKTAPSAGIVTLKQLTTDQITISWTGFTEEESEVRQFAIKVVSSSGKVAMSAVTSGTEEEISGTISKLPDTGSAMKACVTATNIADLSVFVCSEEIYYDASPPRLNKLWLRHTLTYTSSGFQPAGAVAARR